MQRIEDCLFTYGSLMSASGHPMALRLQAEARSLGAATIFARLYDLGSYPGAVGSPDPQDRVHGEMLQLAKPNETFGWLDDYEGCGRDDKEPHAYQRVITPAWLESGQHIDAWVYYYQWPIAEALHLRDGRYVRGKR